MTSSIPYDRIIVGATLTGCAAALEAAQTGEEVLLTEPGTQLASDLTATRRLWLPQQGPLQGLLEECAEEVHGKPALLAGKLKKRLLTMLRQAGVTVLFGARPAAAAMDARRCTGAVFGTKSGLILFPARKVMDATPDLVLQRLSGAGVTVKRGPARIGRVLEYRLPKPTEHLPERLKVPAKLGLWDNVIELHPAAGGAGLVLADFGFDARVNEADFAQRRAWELTAREKTLELAEWLAAECDLFAGAVMGRAAEALSLPSIWSLDVAQPPAAAYQVGACAESGAVERDPVSSEIVFGAPRVPLQSLHPRAVRQPNCFALRGWHVEAPDAESLPLATECNVLVAGGGTAGAPAAIGAAQHGERVLLVETSSELGGTACRGGINIYFHGWREGFTGRLDDRVTEMTQRVSPGSTPGAAKWNISARELALLTAAREKGCDVWFDTPVVDAVVSDTRLEGAIILSCDGLARVSARTSIDATGDGDLAARAGVPFNLGDPRGGNLQTYNQCPWRWEADLAGHNIDLDVADPTDFIDVNRAVHVAYQEGSDFDFSPMPVFREARHFEGEYTFTLRDVFLPRRYPDTITLAQTTFDQHGLQGTVLARLGTLPYHHRSFTCAVPLRVCLPKRLEGLLLTAKALSASKDGFSFLRMQPEAQNIGYAAGVAAAQGGPPFDLRTLQAVLMPLGAFSEEAVAETDTVETDALQETEALIGGDDTALARLLSLPAEEALTAVRAKLDRAGKAARLPLLMALTWFGEHSGVPELLQALNELARQPQASDWDEAGRPTGGFHQTVSTYWRANQLIVLLGLSRDPRALEPLCRIAESTETGGEVNASPRLHWRRIPNYDRIIALCFALERLADTRATTALRTLLNRPGLHGMTETDALDGNSSFAMALLEVTIARTLARCGDGRGAEALADYVEDVRFVLADHARRELEAVTGQDLGYEKSAWHDWISRHALEPQPYTDVELY